MRYPAIPVPLSCLLLCLSCAQGGGRGPVSGDAGGAPTPEAGPLGPDAGTDAGPPKTCEADSECDDMLACTGTETCGSDFECDVAPHSGCDDGVDCTVDECTEPAGDCTHTPDDAGCPSSQVCDAAMGCVDPPPCLDHSECDDSLVCNGTETCDPSFGCRAGTPVDCDDGMSCTADACQEPGGTCTNTGTDGDGDGYVVVGCGAGDDCDDSNPAVNPRARETCNGVDDDCSGMADDAAGIECALGSPPVSCTTSCGTPGTRPCDASCTLGTCAAATETCMNGCDDDRDGSVDEGCMAPAPPNDRCAGAITLGGAGSRSDTLVGATAQASGCGSGVEVFYRVTATRRSIVYLDTFGTGFDTRISYRGTGCPGASSQCVDDSCSTLQTQLAQVVNTGTHYFAVHTFSSATTPGPIALRYQIADAAGGDNTPITSSGTFVGSTSGANAVTASCAGSARSPEDAFYWMQCPGVTRSITATTCFIGTNYDTALHLHSGTTQLACNDDDFGCIWSALRSRLTATTSGAGLYRLFVDGFSTASSGTYNVSISGL